MANEAELLEQSSETGSSEASTPSLRETLEAAFDKDAESQAATSPASPAPAPAKGGATPPVTPAPSAAAPAAPTSTPAAAPASTPAGTPQQGQPTQGQPGQQSQTPAAPAELKAPSQWKPAVRELWAKLPREVQEEVLRREGDNLRLVGSVGQKIRVADEVNAHLQPFAERLKANGVTASAFIGDLFTTVGALAHGDPNQKAEVVANIIQSYGVDLRVLDSMLSSRIRQPPEVRAAQQQAARSAREADFARGQLVNQGAVEAEKAVAAFGADPKHEFFDDVRDMMADLMESGRVQSLDDAYAAAVWAHPDTRKILLQREAQNRAANSSRRADAARRASSAVSGSPTVPSAAGQQRPNMSLRESLEAAFDEHTSL